MATTKGPLFSANASGTLKDAIVYSKNKKACSRRPRLDQPGQPNVESQRFRMRRHQRILRLGGRHQTVPNLLHNWEAYGRELTCQRSAYQHFNLKLMRQTTLPTPPALQQPADNHATGTVSGLNEAVDGHSVTITINWNSNTDP